MCTSGSGVRSDRDMFRLSMLSSNIPWSTRDSYFWKRWWTNERSRETCGHSRYELPDDGSSLPTGRVAGERPASLQWILQERESDK